MAMFTEEVREIILKGAEKHGWLDERLKEKQEEGKVEGNEEMLIVAIRNNFLPEAIETMRKEANITKKRLVELQKQVHP